MIAMRYGTLPIVRETGGLKDTVIPYNQYTGEGTGFSFTHFNGDEMADAVFRAARLFWDNRDAFNGLVENAMKADFSWKRSADATSPSITTCIPRSRCRSHSPKLSKSPSRSSPPPSRPMLNPRRK